MYNKTALKELIRKKGSQRIVAKEMGVSLRTLERVVSGQDIKASYLYSVAKYLGLTIEEVVKLAAEKAE